MENELHRAPATPEDIWAILREVSEKQEESEQQRMKSAREIAEIWKLFKETRQHMEETDRQMKETDRQMKETDRQMKETDRQMKETDRRIDKRMKKLEGLFTTQWGKLMESLVEGDLVALLQARGIRVESTYPRVKGRRNGEHYEFDILAGNGAELVVVEVKTTLNVDHVKQFLAKLGRFMEYQPVYRGKQVYGAVAYLQAEQAAEVYAQRQGLYVIRATGSSASIINDTDFTPRVFE